jgi:hypothetical protein
MVTVKMTFSLDEATANRLNRTAAALRKPKSEVVRDAIESYADRVGRLSDDERRTLLRAFDELVPVIPERPLDDVEKELAEVRRARRGGGRQTEPPSRR